MFKNILAAVGVACILNYTYQFGKARALKALSKADLESMLRARRAGEPANDGEPKVATAA